MEESLELLRRRAAKVRAAGGFTLVAEKLAANGYLLEIDDPAQEWNMVSSYLLDVSSSQTLQSIYGDLCDTLTLGIAVSTQNTERILAMIDYLEI